MTLHTIRHNLCWMYTCFIYYAKCIHD